MIKRLEDAQSDKDNILGVILAAGTNHSAQAVSITHPHAGHQSYLSRQILRQAMVGAGFLPIPNEWWHFDAARGRALRSKYQKLDISLDVALPSR